MNDEKSHGAVRATWVVLLALLGCAFLALPAVAGAQVKAGIAAKVLALSGGKRVKIVWQQDQSAAGNNTFGGADVFKLLGYDTHDDTIRVIAATNDDYTKPLLTADGARVVFTDSKARQVRVIDWKGTPAPKFVASGFAGALWRDPQSGKQWVYIQEGGDGDNAWAPLKRVNLDDPKEVELVWNKTKTNVIWLAVSGDAKHLASCWPWNSCGVISPTYDGGGGGAQHISSGGAYAKGCWSTITPDKTYRVGVFDGAHRNWRVFDGPPPGSNKRLVKLDTAPGINGWEIYHPKHANHARFVTITGPYSVGAMGGNNISKGGPEVEVYLGKLDAGFTKVTDWVKVTSDKKADFFPVAWIDPGVAQQVVIVKLEASPKTVAAGATATLSYATQQATKLTLSPDVGVVPGPSGSVEVSPPATTTYELTAAGLGGPKTRQVTVTVADKPAALASVGVSPSSAVVKPGEALQLVAEPLDQYGRPFAAAISWRVEGGGAVQPAASDGAVISHEVRFNAAAKAGTATVVALAGELEGRATMEVVEEPTIVISSPTAGDRWPAGSTQQIVWTTNLDDVAIQYSLDGGASYVNITASVDRSLPEWGRLAWLVPEQPSTQAVIQIEGYFGEAPTRSAPFAIVAAGSSADAGSPPGLASDGGPVAGAGRLLSGACELGRGDEPSDTEAASWLLLSLLLAARRRKARQRRRS